MSTSGGLGGVALMSCLKKYMPSSVSTFAIKGGSALLSVSGASSLNGKRKYSGIDAIR